MLLSLFICAFIPARRVRRRFTIRRAEEAHVPGDGVQLQPPVARARVALDGDSASERVAVAVAVAVAVEQQAHAALVREALVEALAQLRAHRGGRAAALISTSSPPPRPLLLVSASVSSFH